MWGRKNGRDYFTLPHKNGWLVRLGQHYGDYDIPHIEQQVQINIHMYTISIHTHAAAIIIIVNIITNIQDIIQDITQDFSSCCSSPVDDEELLLEDDGPGLAEDAE